MLTRSQARASTSPPRRAASRMVYGTANSSTTAHSPGRQRLWLDLLLGMSGGIRCRRWNSPIRRVTPRAGRRAPRWTPFGVKRTSHKYRVERRPVWCGCSAGLYLGERRGFRALPQRARPGRAKRRPAGIATGAPDCGIPSPFLVLRHHLLSAPDSIVSCFDICVRFRLPFDTGHLQNVCSFTARSACRRRRRASFCRVLFFIPGSPRQGVPESIRNCRCQKAQRTATARWSVRRDTETAEGKTHSTT